MRRIAAFFPAFAFLLVSSGCTAPGAKSSTPTEPVLASLDTYAPPVQEPYYNPDPYPTSDSAVVVEDADPAGAPSARYHLVARKDTLYGLARMYYGDEGRWKEIYEANQAEISDPNLIRVGQRLLIP